MAHFAELDENNVVLRIVVVNNDQLLDDNGQESEIKGVTFCKQLFGENTNWVQTSYNGNFRKRYAGIGYIYDLNRNVFIEQKPEGDGWILNEESYIWVNPEMEKLEKERELIAEQLRMGVTYVNANN